MKTSTRLDSAVFQLTPTRTRCDLLISRDGKTEKLASGLLTPFLAHLTTAQDQVAKGGYSIILKPNSDKDASWFTKGTVERFVRFVSTPEVLERVYMLESEILQIEEAIVIQGITEAAQNASVDSPMKPMERVVASRTFPNNGDEKAIILYTPGEPPESNGSSVQGGNSKVHLLRVLETRKTMLQKEQGMAFARAMAAGFDIDNLSPLIAFSDCFGASRLRDACKRFQELWKKKHETGQWVEIDVAETMPLGEDFTAMNASGIMLSSVENSELASQKVKSSLDTHQGHPGYFQGPFPQQMIPHWPIQSPTGKVPTFHPYSMQGMPYSPNYPGLGPYFQSPYPANDDPRLNPGLRMGHKRHSMDSSNGNTKLENGEALDPHRTRSLDESEFQKESRKSGGRSGKKQGGVVVIRNLNYITSEGGQDRLNEDSESGSESEEDMRGVSKLDPKSLAKPLEKMENVGSNEVDGGHWDAFQNFLLRDADEETHNSSGRGLFSGESTVDQLKRRHSRRGGDPMITRRVVLNGDGVDGDVMSSEANGRKLGVMRSTSEDFMANNREPGFAGSSSDPLNINGLDSHANTNAEWRLSNNMDDDSYIDFLRGQGGNSDGRNVVDMDSELPLANQKAEKCLVSYEPEDLSMVQHRGAEGRAAGFDPALDYELQGASRSRKSKEVLKKAVVRPRNPLQEDKKKNVGPIRRAKPSKLSPLDEARARAEKLRTFKADLQKMKKEKEAEEMKRIEALKMERQKRIAARGGGSSASQVPVRKQAPTRTSLSSVKQRASKFSDSEPGLVSPLQRYPARAASVGSSESLKMSRTANRLTRSAASLPAPKVTETKAASMAHLRRLSEPKIANHPIASLRVKSKPKVSDLFEVKKLSAIVNHDKGKAALLPELKIRTPTKGVSHTPSTSDKVPQNSNVNTNPITEKIAVVLESEKKKPFEPDVASKPNDLQITKQTTSEVITDDVKTEDAKASSDEKPYEAPHARVSSFEEPCTDDSEYRKATPTSLEPAGSASFKAQVFDSKGSKLEQIPEITEKISQGKESKGGGFKRLLKFGRKSNGDRNSDSDSDNIVKSNGFDGNDNSQVHTLKNLISQDETPGPEATAQKSSRHFSLLSPFRSAKSSEKKPTMM